MAEKKAERLPRPKPDSPVNNPDGGKIRVLVYGSATVKSNNSNVIIERKG